MQTERRRAAAQRVVRLLERRWHDELPNGRIPVPMLKKLAKTAGFQAMVACMDRTDTLPLPDLDFHPVVDRRPDGSRRNLMEEELGDDPRLYVCTDCGDEISRGSERCGPCAHWRKTGVNPK